MTALVPVFSAPPLAFMDMLGGSELLVIFLLVLIFFGGEKMPEFARGLGKVIREFRKAASGVEQEFKKALEEDPAAPPHPTYPPASPPLPAILPPSSRSTSPNLMAGNSAPASDVPPVPPASDVAPDPGAAPGPHTDERQPHAAPPPPANPPGQLPPPYTPAPPSDAGEIDAG